MKALMAIIFLLLMLPISYAMMEEFIKKLRNRIKL